MSKMQEYNTRLENNNTNLNEILNTIQNLPTLNLQEKTVTPTTEEQIVIPDESYSGLSSVKVNAIESEELNIIPSAEERISEGLFNKVTVEGDEDLIPSNIVQGVTVFGVEGNAKASNAKITNGSYLFYNNARIDSVNELIALCDNVTNTSNMFNGCTNLTELDLSMLDTSFVDNMNHMFTSCSKLNSLNLSSFDTSRVTQFYNMFQNCSGLNELNLSSFNTSKVTTMYGMFNECQNLERILGLSSFDTSSLVETIRMFRTCRRLTELDLSSFDFSNVNNTSYMFDNCSRLQTITANFNTSKVTDMSYMFNGCSALTEISQLDTSSVTTMYFMFQSCGKLTTLPALNADKVKNVWGVLVYTTELTNFGGLINLGKGFTQKSSNYSNYALNLPSSSKLTHQSLMNIINGLYDLNLTYDVANGGTLYTQKVTLHYKDGGNEIIDSSEVTKMQRN